MKYSLLDLINASIRDNQLQIRTSAPAVVLTYDSARNVCNVQLSILKNIAGIPQPPVILQDVPVMFPRGQFGGLSYQLFTGDQVLVSFCERDLSTWKMSGAGFPPLLPFLHGNTGAVVIGHVSPIGQGFPPSTGTVVDTTTSLFLGNQKTGVDIVKLLADTLVQLSATAGALPAGAGTPIVAKIATIQAQLLTLMGI